MRVREELYSIDQWRADQMVEHDRRVDVDEVVGLEPRDRPAQAGGQSQQPGCGEMREVSPTEDPDRLDHDPRRDAFQQRDDRAGARQHDFDVGGGPSGANGRHAFREAAVGAVQLETLMHARNPPNDAHLQLVKTIDFEARKWS